MNQALQKKLEILSELIRKDNLAYRRKIREFASELAWEFVGHFSELEDGEVVNLFTQTQAAVFWLLKNCPDQDGSGQDKGKRSINPTPRFWHKKPGLQVFPQPGF